MARLAPGSHRTQRAALRLVVHLLAPHLTLETFPWSQLRTQHLHAIRQQLISGGRAPATVNRILVAVRQVLRACWRLGYLDAETYTRTVDVPPVHGSRALAGRALEPAEIRALFASCREDPDPYRGARDAAVLALCYGAGLRRAEVVSLSMRDWRTDVVRVVGKGNRERWVPLPEGAIRTLRWWIHLRGPGAGPLILSLERAHRITPQALYMILRRRATWAGVASFSPHDLRRSYVSSLLDAGVDLSQTSQLAGHANVQTTLRYDRRPDARLADAVRRLRVPF